MSILQRFLDAIVSVFKKDLGIEPTEYKQTRLATSDPRNVEGTQMRKSVFNVMVAGEKSNVEIDNIISQMQEKDAIGKYPYIINSTNWQYKIAKLPEPEHSMYGTQYTATQKHK